MTINRRGTMNAAAKHHERVATELSPEARRDRAKRKLAEATAELVAAQIEITVSANDKVHQYDSPLGKRRHLELARAGAFPSQKVGKRVLVKRADLNDWLAKNGEQRGVQTEDEEIDEMISEALRS